MQRIDLVFGAVGETPVTFTVTPLDAKAGAPARVDLLGLLNIVDGSNLDDSDGEDEGALTDCHLDGGREASPCRRARERRGSVARPRTLASVAAAHDCSRTRPAEARSIRRPRVLRTHN